MTRPISGNHQLISWCWRREILALDDFIDNLVEVPSGVSVDESNTRIKGRED